MTDAPHGDLPHLRSRVANTPPDHVLLTRVQQRQEPALVDLYERYGGLVFTLALRIVGDRNLAEEVMQDTFLRCWDGAESYDPARGRVAGWLMGITRNRAIDLLRSRQHQARLREQEQRSPLNAAAEVAEASLDEDTVLLRRAVSTGLYELPANQRQLIELAYYGGLTQAEIARLLDEPLGTVKSRMRSGMQRLRVLLRPVIAPDGEEAGHRGE